MLGVVVLTFPAPEEGVATAVRGGAASWARHIRLVQNGTVPHRRVGTPSVGLHATPGAFLLVYPRSAPPTAHPSLLGQVMAATEAQGLGVDPREDGVRGEIGHTDHEGECVVH